MYDGNVMKLGASPATAVYASGTYSTRLPCFLIVSSDDGGYFGVLDATGEITYQRPVPARTPPPTSPPPSTQTPGAAVRTTGASFVRVRVYWRCVQPLLSAVVQQQAAVHMLPS